MQFDENRPIFLQIADSICDGIIAGSTKPGERIPSVREYGASVGVNPNTVMRSYERLTDLGVIYNKRGIGYFVSEDAKELILTDERQRFMQEVWPRVMERITLLGIDINDLLK